MGISKRNRAGQRNRPAEWLFRFGYSLTVMVIFSDKTGGLCGTWE